MEPDSVLGRSGIVNNDSLTIITQANPSPVDVSMPATTEPVTTNTGAADTANQFSGDCLQSEIDEFGQQLFWPSTSKLISDGTSNAPVSPSVAPINQPADDAMVNFGPHEPGIIFDTDTSPEHSQTPAPKTSTAPDASSTPGQAPLSSTPSTFSPCTPERAPRVRYIWVIPNCECKKPTRCCRD